MKLKKLIPMLNISNIETSLDFYKTALGFEVTSPEKNIKEWRWASIRSGDTELMLAECEGNPALKLLQNPHKDTDWPTLFYFYPDDVEKLYAHVKAQGYTPTQLETTFYGMKEFSLQDPDGHALSFGEDADNSA